MAPRAGNPDTFAENIFFECLHSEAITKVKVGIRLISISGVRWANIGRPSITQPSYGGFTAAEKLKAEGREGRYGLQPVHKPSKIIRPLGPGYALYLVYAETSHSSAAALVSLRDRMRRFNGALR